MDITLSLEDKLVEGLRKLAVDRGTTLTGLLRDHWQKLAMENSASGPTPGECEALERGFKHVQFKVGKNCKREELYFRR